MGLSFGNLLGFWALLGIPAVVAIHFLQRRSRQVTVSTLFLLQQLQRESEGGSRVERLRSSIPLWLQLLAVLILTWLLAEPRWMERSSVQQIVAVLDGSASMAVSRERLATVLPEALGRLASATARTEFYLLDSRRDAGHLYHGDSVQGLMAALEKWRPGGGTHDAAPALRLGRGLAGREGTLIYVTDHDMPVLPYGARLLAAGGVEENTGIAGVTVEETNGQMVWRAVMRNYGTTAQTREWWMESGGASGARQAITLPPLGMQNVQGAFADGQNELVLRLSPDRFTADDAAAMVRPQPRQLTLLLPPAEMALPPEQQVLGTVFRSLPGLTPTADRAAVDMEAAYYDPLDPLLPGRPSFVFVRGPLTEAAPLPGVLIVEKHPLTENLNWHGLIAQDAPAIPAKEGDEVLVWQGERPMVFLRGTAEVQLLCFNFDLRASNARRLPAFIITLHRFLEEVRARVVREEWRNVECGQKLRCPVDLRDGAGFVTLEWTATGEGGGGKVTVPAVQAALLTAPDVPGFLELKQGSRLLLKAGAHFADVRESDFTKATSRQDLDGVQSRLVERHSREDAAWRLWLLALLAVLGASWWFIYRPAARRKNREARLDGMLREGSR